MQVNMERWVTKVVNLMRDNKLYAPQGGPIIMSQVIYIRIRLPALIICSDHIVVLARQIYKNIEH